MDKANWVDLSVESLDAVQQAAYNQYKALYRQMKEARQAFEAVTSEGTPEGKRMIFGYNFGKLSVAIVDDDRKPTKPKVVKQSLAEFLAQQA